MNDDPTDVHVLYGKVKLNIPKYNTSFQKMADYIVGQFSKKGSSIWVEQIASFLQTTCSFVGLIRNQYENVKLHVTLMNSSFRKRVAEQEPREPFDCSYILKNYKNFNFGVYDFKEIHLSIRFTTNDRNYYQSLMILKI